MTLFGALRGMTPIGLDLGRYSTKAVQLRRRGSGFEVHRAVELPRRDPETGVFDADEIRRIEGVLARRGFAGTDIAVCAPSESVFAAEVETPPVSKKAPIGQIVRAELARTQRVDAASFEQAYWAVPDSAKRSGHAVVAVGCDSAVLTAGCEAFEAAGLNPAAVDVHSLALARAAELAGYTQQHELLIIADIGWGGTSIVVVYQDAVMYERSAGTLGCSSSLARDPESHGRKIAGEIEASVSYAGHRLRGVGDPVTLLCGGGALSDQLVSGCRAAVSGRVEVLTPGSFVSHAEDAGASSVFALAVSLAGRFA